MAYRNDTKVRQGIRVDGRLVWVEPGQSLDGKPVEAKPEPEPENPQDSTEDPLEGLSDEELRELIEPTPHPRTGRAKLLQMAREQ